MLHHLTLTLAVARLALAAPAPLEDRDLERRVTYPFIKMVAFGDDFTDNGQGSYAHGITGDEQTGAMKHLWGANTWTDGLVPVSYLSQNINIPLKYDYAFGSAEGAQFIGSVCSNANLDPSKLSGHAHLLNHKLVPDTIGQIANFTGGKFNTRIAKTLHFYWTGNNDMIASLGYAGRFTICDKDTLCVPNQQAFLKNMTGCYTSGLTTLLENGAKHILVPNIYPRNLAPWTSQYISNETGMIANFGTVITQANANLKTLTTSLSAKYNAKVMYYDANAFLTKAIANPSLVGGAKYDWTCVDGCPANAFSNVSNFDLYYKNTVINKQPDDFFWMTTVVPTTTVFKYMAADMQRFLASQY